MKKILILVLVCYSIWPNSPLLRPNNNCPIRWPIFFFFDKMPFHYSIKSCWIQFLTLTGTELQSKVRSGVHMRHISKLMCRHIHRSFYKIQLTIVCHLLAPYILQSPAQVLNAYTKQSVSIVTLDQPMSFTQLNASFTAIASASVGCITSENHLVLAWSK